MKVKFIFVGEVNGMWPYLLLCVFLVSFSSFSACRLSNGDKSERIVLNVEFSPEKNTAQSSVLLSFTKDFKCRLSSDRMNFYDNIMHETYAVNGIRFKVKSDIGTSFPVSNLNHELISGANNDVAVINKVVPMVFDYVLEGQNVPTTQGNDTLTVKDAFVITTAKCESIGCWLFGDAGSYIVDLNISIKHRKTTCEFLSPHYFIKMEDVTTQELLVGNGKRSKSEDIKLRCDGIHGIASNPVTVKISDGDWDANGQILLNTISTGSKNVGFKLFRGSESVTLHKGNVLLSVAKYSGLETDYVFPVSAEYALTGGGKPTTGEISSKVIFRVDYQ
ncbi:TPA: fimbrial protein [Citrobacter koseri]|uniref:fimbrial protein n=1 Tax=Citrobacter koseri TaxID=545 RepID=UPI00190149BB|nr:fimbrial protein [Citrobacter koseri]MBJ8985883.1 fimbrial protein [Citrobacter koseri]MBJ9008055.1 fimbrial protein [Citrobacter koseri]MBJ9282663.1 fimbrial protein [Citrobacter koseri]HAT3725224.1 fimbrial protein [Citrobacter koseri]HAT3927361.1 fimbrial protein [Citrobacter koseri]